MSRYGYRRSRPQKLAVLQNDGTADDFIFQVNVVVILLADGQQELGNVVTIQSRTLSRQTTREIGQTDVNYVLKFT